MAEIDLHHDRRQHGGCGELQRHHRHLSEGQDGEAADFGTRDAGPGLKSLALEQAGQVARLAHGVAHERFFQGPDFIDSR